MLARLKLSTAVNPASASARNIARPISPRPNTAIGASRGTVGHALHHQRLDAAGAALRQDAARAVKHFADAAPGHVQVAAHRAGLVRALEGAQHLVADGVFALRHGIESRRDAQQPADRGGAVPHARPQVIGIFGGADQRGAEQFRGPRRVAREASSHSTRAQLSMRTMPVISPASSSCCEGPLGAGIEGTRAPRAPPTAPRDNSCRRARAESWRPQAEFRRGFHHRGHGFRRRARQDAVPEIEDAAAAARGRLHGLEQRARALADHVGAA